MLTWLILVGVSLAVGAVCGLFLRGVWGAVAAAAIPWFGLLSVLLYYEYFVPYQGGGASMWPIAQLFGGTVAAISGALTYSGVRSLRRHRD